MGNPEKFVKSELQTKATASLQAEIQNDLKEADPERTVAQDILACGGQGKEKKDNKKDGCGCEQNRCDKGAP